MSIILFANNALSTLAGPITNTATSANLAPGTGVLFPVLGAGQIFKMTFVNATNNNILEIVNVTGINNAGDQITSMVRGQENTSALPWNAGDFAQNLITAGSLGAFLQTAASTNINSSKIITLSGVFTISSATDYRVGLSRTTSLAPSSVVLPSDASVGQAFKIEDLAANFQAYPVTITPPAGQTIASLTSFVMNVNRQSTEFAFYGSNVWSVSNG